ncbi:MAG: polyprenol monophosphomannose synthase [Bacteroidetes bacterium]|nr:polyprenol monophosphomannose synthase [Bacteroidota bacterium]
MIVPTFNEAENIATVISEIMSLPDDLSALVIDDASPDGTALLVKASAQEYPGRVHLIERAGKLGLGTAYLEGFRFALDKKFELVCEMDADRSHDPKDLPRLIRPVATGESDLVVGSRYIGGVRIMNWPLSRLILSYSAGIYTRMITRLPLQDVTSGYKCIHRRVLEAIPLDRVKSNGYSFQIEINYRAWKLGFRIDEVPIVFTERTDGESKMTKSIVREAILKVWELRLRSIFRKL